MTYLSVIHWFKLVEYSGLFASRTPWSAACQ